MSLLRVSYPLTGEEEHENHCCRFRSIACARCIDVRRIGRGERERDGAQGAVERSRPDVAARRRRVQFAPWRTPARLAWRRKKVARRVAWSPALGGSPSLGRPPLLGRLPAPLAPVPLRLAWLWLAPSSRLLAGLASRPSRRGVPLAPLVNCDAQHEKAPASRRGFFHARA